MKIEDEVYYLKEFIAEKPLNQIQIILHEEKPSENTLSGAEYLPIIEFLLGAKVTSAAVKGLFDIVKNYFSLQKDKISLEKAKITASKIEFELKNKKGKGAKVKLT